MRMISKRQLKELVLYSPQHVARLEAAGKFPKRVRLGPSRVGWIEQDESVPKSNEGESQPHRPARLNRLF